MFRKLHILAVALSLVAYSAALSRGDDVALLEQIAKVKAELDALKPKPAPSLSVTATPEYPYSAPLTTLIDNAGTRPAPRAPAAVPVATQPAPRVYRWPSYPTRSVSGRRWNLNGGQITAEHLADDHSHHAHEHFDYQWLKTLNNDQLTALGTDAHEGNVRERYVVRSSRRAAPSAVVRRQAAPRVMSGCPDGRCPSPRRGLFGWRR